MKCCPKERYLLLLGILLFSLMFVACSQEPQTVEVTREVQVEVPVEVPGPEVQVEVTRIVEVPAEAESAVAVIPFEDQWAGSGHADVTAEAFVHWNEDDPAEVPTSCAKCHSTPGYLDYIGADGSAAGVVDAPAPIGTTVTCEACHNDVTVDMTSVVMPSGIELMNLGPEARCMQCHQGRESTVSVNQKIADAGLTDDVDTISEDLGFSNIHYFAAAATQYGTMAKGGYEYDGKAYDSRFDHVEGYNTCNSCHNPHTLEVRLEDCQGCHTDLQTKEDLVNVRMNGSLVDYDGDGNMEEGIYFEIEGMRELLFQAMTAYSTEVAGNPIVYDPDTYPYFFNDTNADGEISEDEAQSSNGYNTWTPRLTKAAYNYQVSIKDPGRFAHGGKYIIELLYDSIDDLNQAVATPVDLSNARRIDHGHFAGSEEAFRHWDEDDPAAVPGSCSRCHSAAGLPLYLTEGVSISQPTSNGLMCGTCHNDLTEFTLYDSQSVEFPSGAVLTLEDPAANLCINCHQGRESAASVNARIGDIPDDEVSDSLRFVNVHYLPAGATLFGTEAGGGYEYAGQTYSGRNEHVPGFDTCIECHSAHALQVQVEECGDCHEVSTEEDLYTIRHEDTTTDFDGDGDATEGIAQEVETMREALYAAMQSYSSDVTGSAIVYSAASYPYFFNDLNGNGEADPDEANSDNAFATWTPKLLRAAYNYQYATKDPGAFAHNGHYILQLLYDSTADMGGDVTGMTRAEVEGGA